MIKHSLVATLSLLNIVGYSQDPLTNRDILPPSPETAAFAKNVMIPVSYNSGTPQISIPIYTVKSGSIEVPISLSYNASGIRVEEVATWVGLGWSLDAGGMITRTVRGLPDDESSYGYMYVPSNRTVRYVDSIYSEEWYDIEQEIGNGQLDLDPDLYNFSVMGYSGQFYYNQDSAKFILAPGQNISISGAPGAFLLTLPNGYKVYFGYDADYEETIEGGTTTSYIDGMSHSPSTMANVPYSISWPINRIVDPFGKTVSFYYTTEYGIDFGRSGERQGSSITETDIKYRQTFYSQQTKRPVLEHISGDEADVWFKRSSVKRTDVPDYEGGNYALDTIIIKSTQGQEIASYHLDHDYWTSPTYSTSGIIGVSQYADEALQRLYLKSVTEKTPTDSFPPYEFTYSGIELPSRFSTSQDYWGYYNHKSNATKLMPRLRNVAMFLGVDHYAELMDILPNYEAYINVDGADRGVDTVYNQARILEKITYPTGGTSEYSYESNEASTFYLDRYGIFEAPDMHNRQFSFTLLQPANPPYPLYYVDSFTVINPVSKVEITPQLETCTDVVDASCKFLIKIRHLPDSTLVSSFASNLVFNLQLATGKYLVEAFVNGSVDDPPPTAQIRFKWSDRPDSVNFKVGGVRIRKIVSRDGVGNTVSRSLDYHLEGSRESSGALAGALTYNVVDQNTMFPTGSLGYFVSNSAIPLTEDGQTVRYKYVTEYGDSSAASYKTTYTYSDFTGGAGFSTPIGGAPRFQTSWRNGQLLAKQIYEKTNSGIYRMLAEERNYFKVDRIVNYVFGLYGIQVIPYSVSTEWQLLDSTSNASYSYLNGVQSSVQTGTRYLYNDQLLSAGSRTTNSKGETIYNRIWHPSDYNNVSGFNIPALNSSHIMDIPIRQETSVNGKLVSGTVLKYTMYGQPIESYGYQKQALSDTAAHDPNVITDADYFLNTSLYYNSHGNISQVVMAGNKQSTLVWDALNTYPLARVVSADSGSVAYTSFEGNGDGNWAVVGSNTSDNVAVTGNRVHSLSNGSITSGYLVNRDYIVSYWKKSAAGGTVSVNAVSPVAGKTINGWTYYEHTVTPSLNAIVISGSATIDELRLYPQNAQMTSCTVRPLVGMISQCDPNNNVTYYEYDALNRLSLVRDANRYVVKKICYNYSGQPVSCGYDTMAAWQPISSSPEVLEGDTTGNIVVVEKNMNPASATYNQTRNVVLKGGWEGATPCDGENCSGEDKKCVNGVCETGVRVNTGSGRVTGTTWRCYYHYLFSDGSITETFEHVQTGFCPI